MSQTNNDWSPMHGDSPYDPAQGDWQTLVTFFSPTEAYLLRGCLQAGGVPAVVADANLVQTHSLLASAIPVRVMVPEHRFAEAEAVVAAFQRGDFALPDDEDPSP
ncbi:MAG: DUF2007 domain-containing protein [Hydrogenophaga sp.]|uniref:putative signal transducing protein n=1 Tax=Hydrogenophaga sp. TaxID=1904254 RepID=UPI002763026A|nr:DUF2007 domain-containing protein [Hydrogenophaga sp.]MDP2419659.1 DUF2007 domain-containing protein [Hydrogenophaga sp.]MDZ4187722.1 DUF2007 domain-containing protein [Hydrogenophaga sp.]